MEIEWKIMDFLENLGVYAREVGSSEENAVVVRGLGVPEYLAQIENTQDRELSVRNTAPAESTVRSEAERSQKIIRLNFA